MMHRIGRLRDPPGGERVTGVFRVSASSESANFSTHGRPGGRTVGGGGVRHAEGSFFRFFQRKEVGNPSFL